MYQIEESRLVACEDTLAREVAIPEGISVISGGVFAGRGALERVVVAGSVKTVGEGAFAGCASLEEIVFGESLRRLNADCLHGCVSLRSVVLPQELASIRSGAFAGCVSLETLELPKGLRRRIEQDAFADCRSLRRVVIPAGVEMIEYRAFCDCTALEEVVFENPQVRIERGAFVGCEALGEESRAFIEAHTFSRVVLDIRSARRDAVGRLSNFTAREFVFDGVACGSVEGVVQALKCGDVSRQREICRLHGSEARLAGTAYSWKEKQELYWQGVTYPRESEAYQRLLDRLYDAVYAQDASFREDLRQVRGRELSHRLGRTDPKQTVLTRAELVSRLERLSLRSGEKG